MTEKSTFQKVARSDKPLYGPCKLVLCGFGADERKEFGSILAIAGLTQVPKVWVTTEQRATTLTELLELADGSGSGASSGLPRAIIVAGISQAQLVGLMTACRTSGMPPVLWAVLTPVSEKWTVQQLLAELAREREALQKKT